MKTLTYSRTTMSLRLSFLHLVPPLPLYLSPYPSFAPAFSVGDVAVSLFESLLYLEKTS
jgi:hypothetical protein